MEKDIIIQNKYHGRIYIEFFDSKKEAMLREKQLKSARGRDFVKEKLLVK